MAEIPTTYSPEASAGIARMLRQVAGRMPYGGIVGRPPTTLAEAVDWFDKLADVLAEVAVRNIGVEDELRQLRSDINAMRRVLGVEQ